MKKKMKRWKMKKMEDENKQKSDGFKFNIKRNKTIFFNDKKFQNKLDKLDKLEIDTSNYI